ncbi:MAG: helix-turn-helix domain-containing protein [Acidimicrobiales bacterium]|nr:helix-turn-helix domain-containing protein [Acidimicrobiales bacterium]
MVLGALEAGPCALAELTDRTGMARATAHRLAVALEAHELVARDGGGRFVLGPGLARLGRVAGSLAGRPLPELAGPVLAGLRDETGESAQVYVRSGDTRVCVAALESPHSLRTIVTIGAVLPMDRGSAAKILSGDPVAVGRGWAESVEEREKGVASVSAPVLVEGALVAAISVSGPVDRTSRQPGRRYSGAVMRAARELERALA